MKDKISLHPTPQHASIHVILYYNHGLVRSFSHPVKHMCAHPTDDRQEEGCDDRHPVVPCKNESKFLTLRLDLEPQVASHWYIAGDVLKTHLIERPCLCYVVNFHLASSFLACGKFVFGYPSPIVASC